MRYRFVIRDEDNHISPIEPAADRLPLDNILYGLENLKIITRTPAFVIETDNPDIAQTVRLVIGKLLLFEAPVDEAAEEKSGAKTEQRVWLDDEGHPTVCSQCHATGRHLTREGICKPCAMKNANLGKIRKNEIPKKKGTCPNCKRRNVNLHESGYCHACNIKKTTKLAELDRKADAVADRILAAEGAADAREMGRFPTPVSLAGLSGRKLG